MSRRPPSRSTARYRQFDPSAINNIGLPVDANVIAVTPVDGHATWAVVWFDQPITFKAGPTASLNWFVNGQQFSSWGALATDARSITIVLEGAISVGDIVAFDATETTTKIQPISGNIINAFAGTVTATPLPDMFAISSATCLDASTIRITFDAPVAVISTAYGEPFDALSTSGEPVGALQSFLSTRQVTFESGAPITSGTTYDLATDPHYFISLTGATLAAGSGILNGI